MKNNQKTLVDFSADNENARWRIINDGVMGGLSQSSFILTSTDTAVFSGKLSLENNGGFASVRRLPHRYGLTAYSGVALRIKGDGRTYQLRLRTNDNFDGIAYRAEFKTTPGEWITVKIPFKSFIPTFRGRRVANAPELQQENITQIGFLIADKQVKPFRLEIDGIDAYMP